MSVAEQSAAPVLVLRDVETRFTTAQGELVAVNSVSFVVAQGRTTAIVGESGSGKSVLAKTVMGLLPETATVGASSRVEFEGRDILHGSERELNAIRGAEIGMVFQDAMTSLNPVVRIQRQLTESITFHTGVRGNAARTRALELLREVGIPDPEARLRSYPQELSGGMRQRVAIAVAISCSPKLLIADEPTTALDVTVQHQILELLDRLRHDHGMSIILITHDLAIVAGRADQTVVMYAGRVVELGETADVFGEPRHPYTAMLLKCIPSLKAPPHSRLEAVPGRAPDLHAQEDRCAFADRCPAAQPECLEHEPQLGALGSDGPGHEVRCFFPVGTKEREKALAINEAAGRTAAGLEVEQPVGVS